MSDHTVSNHPMKGFRMKISSLPVRPLLLVAAVAGALSCSDTSSGTGPASPGPRLLTASSSYPALATTQVSFWAVKGRNAGADIWYRPRSGQSDSTKFVEFRMGGASLDRRPDGSVIAQGDSVLITLTVSDPTHLIVNYQPSGLQFSATDQPTLKMYYVACGDDLNYDGVVDATDDQIQSQLRIWRQEAPELPWTVMSGSVVKSLKEVDAKLSGFTGYAISY
jgi:hypothetical protein